MLFVVDFLTVATVFLEIFYCCLVWNRWLRPWVVLAAIGMHLFIGFAMGMWTFALIMIYANMAFFPTTLIRRWCDRRMADAFHYLIRGRLQAAKDEESARALAAELRAHFEELAKQLAAQDKARRRAAMRAMVRPRLSRIGNMMRSRKRS